MVEMEWRAIPQDAIRTLIDSLPRRVAACIAVRALKWFGSCKGIFTPFFKFNIRIQSRFMTVGNRACCPLIHRLWESSVLPSHPPTLGIERVTLSSTDFGNRACYPLIHRLWESSVLPSHPPTLGIERVTLSSTDFGNQACYPLIHRLWESSVLPSHPPTLGIERVSLSSTDFGNRACYPLIHRLWESSVLPSHPPTLGIERVALSSTDFGNRACYPLIHRLWESSVLPSHPPTLGIERVTLSSTDFGNRACYPLIHRLWESSVLPSHPPTLGIELHQVTSATLVEMLFPTQEEAGEHKACHQLDLLAPRQQDALILKMPPRGKEISTSKTIARQNKSKQLYDRTHREVKYAINDLVLIWTPIRKVGRADKLQRRYIGPYQILRQTSPVNYEVIEIAEGKRDK
ncbi:hypothetical protein LAZ67_20002572 [Cordylochernes scorpioides]|uniref:Uncharacterized protein n=1 Tax=Cordylochernes scorpioides TaxID=51811 RepID=A0ABY6LKZ5_9ARAC|nr:hypothetical protein LAZ67_20002572 [Cordylochernes scorpioides]